MQSTYLYMKKNYFTCIIHDNTNEGERKKYSIHKFLAQFIQHIFSLPFLIRLRVCGSLKSVRRLWISWWFVYLLNFYLHIRRRKNKQTVKKRFVWRLRGWRAMIYFCFIDKKWWDLFWKSFLFLIVNFYCKNSQKLCR